MHLDQGEGEGGFSVNVMRGHHEVPLPRQIKCRDGKGEGDVKPGGAVVMW